MARTAVLGRLNWKLGEVVELIDETPRVRSIVLVVSGWPGHRPGQHVDIRLTAEDGYQAQRSYSIASGPEDARLMLTVERLADGEVSPYLVDELRPGDNLELRGPIGGYFVWEETVGARCSWSARVPGSFRSCPCSATERHPEPGRPPVSCTRLAPGRTSSSVTSWRSSPADRMGSRSSIR